MAFFRRKYILMAFMTPRMVLMNIFLTTTRSVHVKYFLFLNIARLYFTERIFSKAVHTGFAYGMEMAFCR